MAIQSQDTIIQRQLKVSKLKGTGESGRAETDEMSRIRGVEVLITKLVKRIAAIENKIKVMVKVTRDRNGKETIIVKE